MLNCAAEIFFVAEDREGRTQCKFAIALCRSRTCTNLLSWRVETIHFILLSSQNLTINCLFLSNFNCCSMCYLGVFAYRVSEPFHKRRQHYLHLARAIAKLSISFWSETINHFSVLCSFWRSLYFWRWQPPTQDAEHRKLLEFRLIY